MSREDTNHDGSQESLDTPDALYETVLAETQQVLIGNEEVVEQLLIGLLTRGHVLIEGVPGVAKTTIANVFARALGLEFSRVQMTPDILPADITGTYIYEEHTGEFALQRGPIFTDLLVADEINRATPKTQSALLEAMRERTVTIRNNTLSLPDPFIVIATQNPIEMTGTFELPEAQRDRFQLKVTIDLPERELEKKLVDRFDTDPYLGPDAIDQVLSKQSIIPSHQTLADVHVAPPVVEYILDLVEATRTHPDVAHGASPRATLAFLNAGKAKAAIRGRNYVIPDDIKALAESILGHRLVLNADADLSDVTPAEVVDDILDRVDPPGAGANELGLMDGSTG